jgi:hypothetical protein
MGRDRWVGIGKDGHKLLVAAVCLVYERGSGVG